MSKKAYLDPGIVALSLFAFAIFSIARCTERSSSLGYVDYSGRLVNDLSYIRNMPTTGSGELFPFSCDRALVVVGDKCWFIRKDSTRLTLAFTDARSFSEGLAAVCPSSKPRKWGYINTDGVMAIVPAYHKAGPFSEGMAAVKLLDQEGWQFIDRAGKVAIKGSFEDVGKFSCGLASVRVDGKWGFIDKSGKFVIPPKWDKVGEYREGVVWLEQSSASTNIEPRRVYMDEHGVFLFECSAKNWSQDPFLHFPATAELLPDKVGGFDDENSVAHPFIEDGDCFDGLIVLKVGDKYGYCDRLGQIKIEPQFDYAWHFSEGLALVYVKRDKGLLGYIDRTGKVVVNFQFKRAGHFSEGLAPVSKREDRGWFHYNYIDKSGHEAISGPFLKAGAFSSGRAAVGEFHLIVP